MTEILPIVGGCLAGALCTGYVAGRARWVALALASVLMAVLAGFVSGELARSAAYLLVDATEAFGTGALTVVALTSVSSWRR